MRFAAVVVMGAIAPALVGCGDDDGTGDPGGGGEDGGGEADASGSPDAGLPPADEIVTIDIAGCGGIGPGSEDCHARLLWRPDACGGGACARLMVYWSGGEQSCATGTYDPLLERYADAGFVAVCAQPFTTSAEAGRYPYADELERMSHLTARARAEAGAAWDGTHLLIAGVSHGATAPPAAIAAGRAFHDQPEVWSGSEQTAVVLFDGISNPATLEEWTAEQDNCASWHRRFVGRYGDGTPLAHSCGNGACYCADPPHADDWARDVTAIGAAAPPSPYTCEDFAGDGTAPVLYRYVSCGGGANPACGAAGTIIPDDQQEEPYLAIRDCTGITASYQDLPNCPHTACGGWEQCGGADALAWLEENGW